MTANPIVSIAGLNKWYGDFHVLRDIESFAPATMRRLPRADVLW